MMNAKQMNLLVREIEVAYRKEKNRTHATEGRLRQINPEEVRRVMQENQIGLQCEKCLNKSNAGRYCSKAHSEYYRRITNQFYGVSYPFDIITLRLKEGTDAEIACPVCKTKLHYSSMSVDHVLPISKGGLEFDRENLQWMCLPCNLKKHNYIEDKRQKKLEVIN